MKIINELCAMMAKNMSGTPEKYQIDVIDVVLSIGWVCSLLRPFLCGRYGCLKLHHFRTSGSDF